jgi:hypothetical protein
MKSSLKTFLAGENEPNAGEAYLPGTKSLYLSKDKTMPRLENWSLILIGNSSSPPECQSKHLVGNVYGHPKARHKDGKEIRTSAIIGIKDGKVLVASGMEYELGKVNPEYEAEFPGARARILANKGKQ